MKITKEQIKKIIAEELQKEIFGQGPDSPTSRDPGFGLEIQKAKEALEKQAKAMPKGSIRSTLVMLNRALMYIGQMSNQEIQDPAKREMYMRNSGIFLVKQLNFALGHAQKIASGEGDLSEGSDQAEAEE